MHISKVQSLNIKYGEASLIGRQSMIIAYCYYLNSIGALKKLFGEAEINKLVGGFTNVIPAPRELVKEHIESYATLSCGAFKEKDARVTALSTLEIFGLTPYGSRMVDIVDNQRELFDLTVNAFNSN